MSVKLELDAFEAMQLAVALETLIRNRRLRAPREPLARQGFQMETEDAAELLEKIRAKARETGIRL